MQDHYWLKIVLCILRIMCRRGESASARSLLAALLKVMNRRQRRRERNKGAQEKGGYLYGHRRREGN